MLRLTIWDRHYREVGTIEREIAGTLLDMGAKLQEDYGANYKVEYIDERKEEICSDCGKSCFKCC